MNSEYHLVVFGAHALDAELLAGGVIAKVSELPIKVTIVHMTRGERGHPTKGSEAFAEQLDEEREQVAQLLAADQIWMGYPAGELPLSAATVKDTYDRLCELKPTHIVTHWRGSWHPRHVNTHYIVSRAVKRAVKSGAEIPLQGLYYGENCEDLEGFNPGLYVELSEEALNRWFEALRGYELFRLSESSSPSIPYSDYYMSMAKIRGLESGVTYAQAFMEERKLSESLFNGKSNFIF